MTRTEAIAHADELFSRHREAITRAVLAGGCPVEALAAAAKREQELCQEVLDGKHPQKAAAMLDSVWEHFNAA
jgi:hypothetical protein